MKLVEYDTLVPETLLIQPHIAWLLANVPDLIESGDKEQVTMTLEDLAVKYAKLQGKILALEIKVEEFDDDTRNILLLEGGKMSTLAQGSVDACLVVSVTTDSIAGFEAAEDCLRGAWAETIVVRGEMALEKESRYAKAYGAHPPFNMVGVATGRMTGDPFVPAAWLFKEEEMALNHCLDARDKAGEAEALEAAKANLTAKVTGNTIEMGETVKEHPEVIDLVEDPCPTCDKPGAPGQPACTGCHGFRVGLYGRFGGGNKPSPAMNFQAQYENASKGWFIHDEQALPDHLRNAHSMLDIAAKAEAAGALTNARIWRDAAQESFAEYNATTKPPEPVGLNEPPPGAKASVASESEANKDAHVCGIRGVPCDTCHAADLVAAKEAEEAEEDCEDCGGNGIDCAGCPEQKP